MQQETLGKASFVIVFKFSKEYLLLSSVPSACSRCLLLGFHVFPPAPPFRVNLSLSCRSHTPPGAVNTDELTLSLLCVDSSSVTSSISLGALSPFELLQTAVIPGASLPQKSLPFLPPSLLTMLGDGTQALLMSLQTLYYEQHLQVTSSFRAYKDQFSPLPSQPPPVCTV